MSGNLVSVVVPVYNVEDYLDRCLQSIVRQTYKDLEILLIDDGSTDGSLQKCLEWKDKDNRIILHSKKNEGLGCARNDGIGYAHGKYIAFIDSDDWWELNAIEELYGHAVKYDADLVYMNFYWEYTDKVGECSNRIFCQHCIFDGAGNAEQYPELVFSSDARTWSKFYRTDLFIKNNIRFPAHPFEDFPVNPILVLSAKKICQVHKPLYHYDCTRKGSITGNAKSYLSIPGGLEELHTSLKSRGYLPKWENAYQSYAIKLCRSVINERRFTGQGDAKLFWNFLHTYCGEKLDIYRIHFVYAGSFAGYQVICQNVFYKQIVGKFLYHVPESYDDEEDRNPDLLSDADFLCIDLIGEEEGYSENEIIDLANRLKKRTIVLELYYAEKYGTDSHSSRPYPQLDEIRRKNRRLKERYASLADNLGEACVSVGFEEFDNYTYLYTPYGCMPEFYNGRFYTNAFHKISEQITGTAWTSGIDGSQKRSRQ